MNKREALIEMAIQRGASIELVNSAITDINRDAIQLLIKQMRMADDAEYIVSKYIDEIITSAYDSGKLLSIFDLLIEFPETTLSTLIMYLTKHTDYEIVARYLREILMQERASNHERSRAAHWICWKIYGFSDEALNDRAVAVRYFAATYFEKVHNTRSTEALLKALHNEIPDVRTIACWYMGRKKIVQATEILQEMLVGESDIDTLRALIWALGVLRAVNARPQLEKMVNHSDPLIQSTAQQALRKLDSVQ